MRGQVGGNSRALEEFWAIFSGKFLKTGNIVRMIFESAHMQDQLVDINFNLTFGSHFWLVFSSYFFHPIDLPSRTLARIRACTWTSGAQEAAEGRRRARGQAGAPRVLAEGRGARGAAGKLCDWSSLGSAVLPVKN